MDLVTGATRVRLTGTVIACAAVLVAYLVWFQPSDKPAAVAPVSQPWQTVEFQGQSVEVPASWRTVTENECGFRFAERYPEGTICNLTSGVRFHGRAMFDPSRLPGIAQSVEEGQTVWSGYVYAGDFAVFASDPDRRVVKRVLDSARPPSALDLP